MYKKFQFKNGIKLILAPLPSTKAVTVLVLLPVGSRYEFQQNNGISHFIEHLLFKGTKKRPTSLDLTKELDSVGAEYNAFTAKDQTGYYIKVAADKIKLAFDILSDMLFNSLFDSAEMEKERGVIIEEINMYEDNPLLYIEHIFEQTIFSHQPLGFLVSGPRSVIKEISRQELINYKNKFYQPAQMIITVAGSFSKSQVIKLTKRYFSQAAKKNKKPVFRKISLNQCQPRINLVFKKTEQVQLALGFPAYPAKDRRLFALYLLAVILGGNMSSRLFTIVREKHGLAYFIKTSINTYQDTGTLIVQAGLDKKRISQAITLILQELKRVKSQGVSEPELQSAKEFLKGKFILDLEDSEDVAGWFGKQELLLGKIYTPQQRIKKFFSVSKSQIKKAAEQIIQQQKLSLALIGPFKDKKVFQRLLKI